MSIEFSEARWEKTVKAHEAWWEGALERPLVPITLSGRDPGRPKPCAPLLTQSTVGAFNYTAEQLIDRLDYELSRYTFLGDAFPMVNFDMFGPGVLAAFLGATLDNSTGAVWFRVLEQAEPASLQFAFDPDNRWFLRIVELYKAGMKRWQGSVAMGMPDLGGVLDVLAVFLGTENMMIAFIDEPEEIQRLAGEIEAFWFQYFQAFTQLLGGSPGFTNWSAVLSQKPFYILQSDVTYMMGKEHFRAFALAELRRSCGRLERSIYHLDGVGALRHLDDLLSITALDCIQWIPGVGAAHPAEWPEVYQTIRRGGKKLQIIGVDALQAVMDTLGSGVGISVRDGALYPPEREDEFRELLHAWGVEP
jgi:5-methyltetrahydrofolate--homocysteine methyltransferase